MADTVREWTTERLCSVASLSNLPSVDELVRRLREAEAKLAAIEKRAKGWSGWDVSLMAANTDPITAVARCRVDVLAILHPPKEPT